MGRVAAPYGVRGWMKVQLYTDAPEALLGFATWRMTMRGEREAREYRLVEGRAHGGALVAKIEGVDSPEAAALLRGSTVEVARESLPEAGEGEVYLADLPGCAVVSTGGAAVRLLAPNRNLLIIADVMVVNQGFAEQHPQIMEGMVRAARATP